jgi:thiol-disulfide isomerase/thioredoxin
LSKHYLNLAILISAILLGVFHYKLKPAPSEKELRELANDLSSRTIWQGQIAPDFELQTVGGEHFHLAENVGKKTIVLNFFATWCDPCRAEMPELNRYFDEHKNESFLLLGVDAEESRETVNAFLDEIKVDFPVGIDTGPIRKQYGVSGLPTTVVIGVDGRVQLYETGALANAEVAFDNLRSKNFQAIQKGEVISPDEYRLQAQKQPALPLRQTDETGSYDPENKLSPRAKQIAARMDCPCGCDKKVHACTCNTSTKIKNALATDDLQGKSDDDVIKSLNKRFCAEAM